MKARLEEEYKGLRVLILDPLCQAISCHIGLNCLGVGISRVRSEVMDLLKIENQ